MSLTEEELKNHADNIKSSRRVKNKAVILCEGDISSVKSVGKTQLINLTLPISL